MQSSLWYDLNVELTHLHGYRKTIIDGCTEFCWLIATCVHVTKWSEVMAMV